MVFIRNFSTPTSGVISASGVSTASAPAMASAVSCSSGMPTSTSSVATKTSTTYFASVPGNEQTKMEIERLETAYREAERYRSNLQKNINSFREDLCKYKSELDDLLSNAKPSEIEDLYPNETKKKIESLKSKIVACEAAIETYNEEYTAISNKMSALIDKINQLKNQIQNSSLSDLSSTPNAPTVTGFIDKTPPETSGYVPNASGAPTATPSWW